MTPGSGESGDTAICDALRDYSISVIRFISDSALDPHLYFEKKLTSNVMLVKSIGELLGILTSLIELVDETYSGASSLSGIDQAMGRDGLPSLSLLRTPETRSVGLVLACGRIRTSAEYRLVGELTRKTSIPEADRFVAERLLADYEQA
ncbi:MAG: hypothetical protein QGG54_03490 [Gammaproteobacteria bacterium]|jgi:hypothetical protein|nr:hypothetical protein [Gammaproteobacteria bacterium]MDP6673596.1 hypothetical protein [Gammaproteobacteria bacterium]